MVALDEEYNGARELRVERLILRACAEAVRKVVLSKDGLDRFIRQKDRSEPFGQGFRQLLFKLMLQDRY